MVHFEGYMLIVKDAQCSKKFYEQVLGLQTTLDLGKHIVFNAPFFLLQEDDWCTFSQIQQQALQYSHHSGELVFEVEDITSFMQHLSSFPDILKVHDLKEHPWGRHAIRFYDPDGHVVEVGESMKVVVKRFLKQGMSIEETAKRSEFPESFVRMCLEELKLS